MALTEQSPLPPREVAEIEADAARAGVDMALVLAMAKVASTTWWRWKTSVSAPRPGNLQRVRDAIQSAKLRSAA